MRNYFMARGRLRTTGIPPRAVKRAALVCAAGRILVASRCRSRKSDKTDPARFVIISSVVCLGGVAWPYDLNGKAPRLVPNYSLSPSRRLYNAGCSGR